MKTPLSLISSEPADRASRQAEAADCVALALAHEDFSLAATSVASALARDLSCEHVAIGLFRGPIIRLVAWSDVAELSEEHGAVRQIVAAMEEAADQHGSLRYPVQPEDPPRILLMHADLSNAHAGCAVLSIPLSARQRVIGAITLLRKQLWAQEDIDRLETLARTLGPLLQLRQRADESLFAHLRRALRHYGERLRGPGALGLKLLSLGVLLALCGVLLVPIRDTLSAPARLEGVIQRSISAPADSFIQDVLARPGASVRQGDLLLTLNDTDLRNEQLRLESELARFRSEQAEAFARQDRGRMVTAQARAEEVAAQLALIEDQLSRTRLVAPFDGVVIRGDLQQHAGAPVKRGDVLMVLAPSGDYRLVLQVDERDVARLEAGATGEVVFAALPDESIAIRVERVTPVASLKDGLNSFEVEASLKGDKAGLRPGLEGVARIGEGRRPLAMIWGGRLIDWVSFKLWSWFG